MHTLSMLWCACRDFSSTICCSCLQHLASSVAAVHVLSCVPGLSIARLSVRAFASSCVCSVVHWPSALPALEDCMVFDGTVLALIE